MNSSNAEVALSVSGLNKSYGSFQVIRNLDLRIETGAIHGLVGLNGSGKTTIIECILGLQGFNGGLINVLGLRPAELHLAQGKVVGIFDTPSLYPNLTVRQCLEHGRLLCERPLRSPAEVERLLSLDHFSSFKIKHLSLGNKRRASIAQALLGNPELIVLDEPFNGLDAGGVDDVLQLISDLNHEAGTAFLLSSHQLPYLEQICSHIAILHRGTIAVSNDIDSLLQHTTASVQLRTPQEQDALKLIERLPGCDFSHRDAGGCLHVELTGMESAQLNKVLVESGIAVAEMVLERASLAGLFRRITIEEAA